ncbi:hypothetical protein LVB77_19385 [Lysobacter sp. 5GHs7-4]|uniref:hypothetical protein n=1 Tax=Lysobacter sp. 5GHs7-4 TaxID=2904253 RepID=UPI001E3C2C78|nr:hypothetical protein [Lysobacter sp. 5GHs7-4]UHQ22784.1 hypothetical protein LVB77_19385 [Lysobacter sp. 5GHs7-4]
MFMLLAVAGDDAVAWSWGWDALAALGTLGAVLVALGFPLIEWVRNLRERDVGVDKF